MENNKCFEMNYLTLPLPFDNMFANERHFERIVLDETSESLVDTISCLYILLYRYCYKTPFPIILIESTKKIQFYLQKHDVTYSEMKYEIEHEIGLGKNTLINEELQVVFTKDIKVDNFIRKFSHLVLLFNITERNDKTFVTELYYNKIVFYETTIKRLIENLYYLKKQVKSNNNINININNIPPRTKEQKQERYAHAKNNRSVDYKDEELPTILYNGFNSLYGDKEDILKDHDICLTMALVKQFFEKFKQYRGERHPMVYANDLDQFLSMIRNADLDMVKDGIVEEDEEPQYYLDMMDEYFSSNIGKNNNMDCDYHIWLFFTEKTQNILYNRVKQKREE